MRTLKLLTISLILLTPGLNFGQGAAGQDTPSSGKLTGVWKGTYHYPADANQAPVNFQMMLIHDGSTVVGFIKEPNTFGERREPWLHATLRGRFQADGAKLTFRKTYDGTAGPSHDVEYTGELSRDGTKVEGTWDINGLIGRFTLEKLRLDERTVGSIGRGPE